MRNEFLSNGKFADVRILVQENNSPHTKVEFHYHACNAHIHHIPMPVIVYMFINISLRVSNRL